ncbi:YraN family protein [Shimia sp.]|uniref:YraN family protein n=1 Tax=Shimia sp. TaxID=1954381 RepID=UPI0035679658
MSFLRHSDFTSPELAARQRRGRRAYHAGLGAEESVERHYRRRGFAVAARRCRNGGGELDLVLRDGARLVFVEVKQSRDFASAAARLSVRQIARLHRAAEVFLAGEPAGSLTECRFDVALVDGRGEIEILENAQMGF